MALSSSPVLFVSMLFAFVAFSAAQAPIGSPMMPPTAMAAPPFMTATMTVPSMPPMSSPPPMGGSPPVAPPKMAPGKPPAMTPKMAPSKPPVMPASPPAPPMGPSTGPSMGPSTGPTPVSSPPAPRSTAYLHGCSMSVLALLGGVALLA